MAENILSDRLLEKLSDRNWRLRNIYYIPTEDGETVLFKPNTIQEKIMHEQSGFRDLILKYRQGGVSTYKIIDLLDEVLFGGINVYNVFVTHRQDLLDVFFKKVRFIYDSIPDYIKVLLPEPSVDNANQLFFAKTRSGKMLNNSLKISLSVRGQTPTSIHISEFAFIEKQAELKQQIDQFRKTKITIETTANGIGNVFYNMCMLAKNGKGSYKLLFYPWYIEERNFETPPDDFCLTEDEKNLAENFKLSDGQIYWRRIKIEDSNSLGLNGLDKFHEENPITIESAFISSGSTVFDLNAPYKIVYPEKEYEGFKIFQKQQDQLIIGVDMAEGGNTGDFSTMTRYNKKGELVFTYKARADEELLAKKLDMILNYENEGRKYTGWIIPENNIGKAFINECKKYSWFYLMHHEIKTDVPINQEREANKYGFRTTSSSKDYIIRNFRGAIHKKEVEISPEIKSEIDTFIYDSNNRPNAQSPNHDDLIMATMIAYFALSKIYGLVTYEEPNNMEKIDRADDLRKNDVIKLKYGVKDDDNRTNMINEYYSYEEIL